MRTNSGANSLVTVVKSPTMMIPDSSFRVVSRYRSLFGSMAHDIVARCGTMLSHMSTSNNHS
jgi:hypothetical protein